ncbi:Hypothetical_protein [Hexamita inflata]|uniref:Hypothetical_protein n=1 Tax=Hexamita inflata TaxID=28002 RepID=A0AA86U040_9EUKA|nr:Hypothetical protein HINF_LOCUS21107 [Hexamita inflata]
MSSEVRFYCQTINQPEVKSSNDNILFSLAIVSGPPQWYIDRQTSVNAVDSKIILFCVITTLVIFFCIKKSQKQFQEVKKNTVYRIYKYIVYYISFQLIVCKIVEIPLQYETQQ